MSFAFANPDPWVQVATTVLILALVVGIVVWTLESLD